MHLRSGHGRHGVRSFSPLRVLFEDFLKIDRKPANSPTSDLDLVARAIRHTVNHTNLQGWQAFFEPFSRYTVEGKPAGVRCVFTADPENIKAILATQFTDYGKGKPFHDDWKEFLGDSIFTTDLDQWHNSRQLIRPQFIKDRVSDLEVFERHVQILMGQIGKRGSLWDGRQGGELDVSDLFFRYTLDAATDFLLGRSVGSLELEEHEFADAFNEVQRVQNMIARAGYVFLLFLFKMRFRTDKPAPSTSSSPANPSALV